MERIFEGDTISAEVVDGEMVMQAGSVVVVGTIAEGELAACFIELSSDDCIAESLRELVSSAIGSVDISVPEERLYLLDSLKSLSAHVSKEILALN